MEFVDEMNERHFQEMENEAILPGTSSLFLNTEFCDPAWSFASQITNTSTFMGANILPSLDFEDKNNFDFGCLEFDSLLHQSPPRLDNYFTDTNQNAAERLVMDSADELGKLVELVQKPTSVCTFNDVVEKCSKTPFINNLSNDWDNNLRPETSGQNRDYGTSSSGCTSEHSFGSKNTLFSNLGLDKLLYGTSRSSCSFDRPGLNNHSSSKRRRFESCSINVKNGNFQAKGQENPSKTIKKRAKPGTRPVPKDRLQTYARLAELRELIPNGEKMSIDRLLQRTIKQLHFLQSVTKHAKRLAKTEVVKDRKDEKYSNNVASGVTWACEIENETMICPLIVEDLSTPGQMLIEILCQEQGFFLEIVDIIRSFGLNILKGFMEVHEAKICAHYIVEAEANRFVSRHEIFSSLVQLLQLTGPNNHLGNVRDDGVLMTFDLSETRKVDNICQNQYILD